jgi:hypothetical protein
MFHCHEAQFQDVHSLSTVIHSLITGSLLQKLPNSLKPFTRLYPGSPVQWGKNKIQKIWW